MLVLFYGQKNTASHFCKVFYRIHEQGKKLNSEGWMVACNFIDKHSFQYVIQSKVFSRKIKDEKHL